MGTWGPGNFENDCAADHLYKVGTLKTKPKAWTDYYLPSSADLNGN